MGGNWRPAQGDTSMATSRGDWRAQSSPESRQWIVNKIMETLKKHFPLFDHEGLSKLRELAVRFEEICFTAADSQDDYLQKITLKMLALESNTLQSTAINSAIPSTGAGNQNPAESGSLVIQFQANNPNGGLAKPYHQSLPQNIHNNTYASFQCSGQGGVIDWQEECYHKLKSLKDQYFTDISELHQNISMKLQQKEALGPQGQQSDQHDKLKNSKSMLELMLSLLQITKNSIPVGLKEKLPIYEKQIIDLIASNPAEKKVSQAQGQQKQQFQHPAANQQSSLVFELQLPDNHNHKNQVNSISLQGSEIFMQNISMPLLSTHQIILNKTAQSASNNTDSVQASSFNLMQHPGTQNSMSASQQNNMNTLPQNALNNALQIKAGLMQPNSDVLHHQHVKQNQLQKAQTQMNQQLAQNHIRQQKQINHHQRQKQKNKVNEVNELETRQVPKNKPEYSAGQQRNYYNLQMEPGTSYPVSSPKTLQASHPQISHHSSPQNDRNGLLLSIPKAKKAHISSGNSPLAVQPSTPSAPSPIPVESEKSVSSISSFGHVGHQQTNTPQTQPHSIAVNTPGISASSLLDECTRLGGSQSHVPIILETSANEQPMERLIKVVQSLTPEALSSSVADIESVVSLIDQIAGSAPGNGSRSAVGEDLVAKANYHLQACSIKPQDGGATAKKLKRHASAMSSNYVTSAGFANESFGIRSESSELDSHSFMVSHI